MIVALAFVCMSLAVLQSTNVPSNSTEDNGDKMPTDFNISSPIGDLLATISINPEMFENVTTHIDEREDTGCETCNTTLCDIPLKRVPHCDSTVTKLPVPAPTHGTGTVDSNYWKMIRMPCGTTKGSTQTESTQGTSPLRTTATTSQSTRFLDISKLEISNSTVVTQALTSFKNFLNGSSTESTKKAFRTESTLTSPFMGRFSLSTRVVAHMAPPIPDESLVASSTASINVVTEMTTDMAVQVSAVGKSNAVNILTLATTTKAISEGIKVVTTNAMRTMGPEKTTNKGSVVVMSCTHTTDMASSLMTEATTKETTHITPPATTMQASVKTREGTAKTVGGNITGESIKVINRSTNGVTTPQQQEKNETGNVIGRTTSGVTIRVIQGSTKRGTNISQGQTDATPSSENVTTRKVIGETASATTSGKSEVTDTASHARATIATEVLSQLLDMMDSTTKNESKVTEGTSPEGLSSTRATTSMDSSSVTPSSMSTKGLDRKAYLINELEKSKFPSAHDETTLKYTEDENNEEDTEETDEETDTTDGNIFTGTSIWTSGLPMETTSDESDTNDLLPDGNLFETTQRTKPTQNIFEKTNGTTSKTTPTENEELAPPARHRFNESFESTTEALEGSSESTNSIITVSNTKGKVHLLHNPFMIHERNTASGCHSGATHKSREKKSQSRHAASHERKKGAQSPSLSGFTSSKKQRKSLFRKSKNSETTPVKS